MGAAAPENILEFDGGQIMWLLFGIIAIITAILNVIWTIRHRETKWFRFISLSFTTLTLCAFYSMANHWVVIGDDSALLDVMPTLSDVLWFLTIASIIINGISLVLKRDK